MKKIAIFFLLMSILAYASQIVYITPKGKKYHSSKECRTLKRSKIINEISSDNVGNRRACGVCY